MMNGKTTAAKFDDTKAAAKAVETKAAAKVEETKAAAKAVEAKVAEKVEETKTAAKAVEAKVAEKAEAAVKETKKRKPRTKSAKKAGKEKDELKPEVYLEYQGNSALVEAAIEKAKEQFVAEGHRVSSIKSLQIYLKPEDFAAYYVINQKNSGKVDLF